jgi:hypothetical protein
MTPTFYILLFCASLTVTYIVVRLGLLHSYPVLMGGVILNSLCFFLFALSRNNTPSHALSVGIALGILFTGMSIGLGKWFRGDAPVKVFAAKTAQVAHTPNA